MTLTSPVDNLHSTHSVLREVIVEHLFVGLLLKRLWVRGVFDAEILRSEYDGFGYDLVISWRDVVRHVQLKSGLQMTPARLRVSRSLAEKPAGCVVCIGIDKNLELVRYRYLGTFGHKVDLGDRDGKALVYKVDGSKTPKPRIALVSANMMQTCANADALLDLLFGPDVPSVKDCF